jgi:hypothetical protein
MKSYYTLLRGDFYKQRSHLFGKSGREGQRGELADKKHCRARGFWGGEGRQRPIESPAETVSNYSALGDRFWGYSGRTKASWTGQKLKRNKALLPFRQKNINRLPFGEYFLNLKRSKAPLFCDHEEI